MRRNIIRKDKLLIVWTGSDREVALNMINLYALNAKKNDWWDEITLLIWGPSSKLLSVDSEIQVAIRKLKEVGISVVTCKSCTENYGVSSRIQSLGIDVKNMGEQLTQYLKNDWKIITF